MGWERLFTFEERQEIEKGIKNGEIARDIAKRLNRSASAIQGEIKKGGGREKFNAAERQERANNSMRKVGASRAFTKEQKQKISEMAEQECSINEIRYAIGCSYWRIKNYLEVNGLLEDSFQPSNQFIQRLESLEMQVEILTDQLKECLCQK